jgi:homeobox protein YOX1/YHP1
MIHQFTTCDNQVQKKTRARTTPEQLKELLKLYQINPLPTLQQRQELGAKINMTPRAVQVWFQNRRQNQKRQQQYTRLPSPAESIPSPRSDSDMESRPKSPTMAIDFLLASEDTERSSLNDNACVYALLSLSSASQIYC